MTHVNQWLLLSDFVALSASTWNCEKVSLQCNIRTRYVRVPGKRPPLAVCNSSKPPANQGLQGSCYRIDTWECFKMMQDMYRYVMYNSGQSRKFKKYARNICFLMPSCHQVPGSTSPAVQTATPSAVGRAQRHSHRSALPALPALEAPTLQVSLGQWRTPRHLSGGFNQLQRPCGILKDTKSY